MTEAFFVIPGDLTLPTGGYGYDRQVLAHAAGAGLSLTHLPLPGGYPFPDAVALEETARRIAATPAHSILLVDGLAYGAMPEAMIAACARPVIALCHHPLALEPGLAPETQARLRASERAALALARHVIVTGPQTAGIVARDFGVAPENITVALPGTVRAERAKGSGGAGPLRLLAVGSIIPRKAYDVMIAGLATLTDFDWHLDIAGATQHAPETVAALVRQIAACGLGPRVSLLGPLSEAALDAAYAGADLFVMTSLYEGYGMVIAEAMARGLPIVAASGGAIADTMPDGAGIKVTPGDEMAFAAGVGLMLSDAACRQTSAEHAWQAGQALPSWADTAKTIADVIRRIAP